MKVNNSKSLKSIQVKVEKKLTCDKKNTISFWQKNYTANVLTVEKHRCLFAIKTDICLQNLTFSVTGL